ncbi:hypothetical protein ACLQ2Q_13305 [Microbacterium sp. DT81.1]|uniref:hypothetical protein n=1 Tax=Microbacterium sp. DT81.1 TaxID=3393413 RepID=UPI003CF67619
MSEHGRVLGAFDDPTTSLLRGALAPSSIAVFRTALPETPRPSRPPHYTEHYAMIGRLAMLGPTQDFSVRQAIAQWWRLPGRGHSASGWCRVGVQVLAPSSRLPMPAQPAAGES